MGSSTTSFPTKNGVDLNLGHFLIDHGQNQRDLQRCVRKVDSIGRTLGKRS